MSAARGGGLLRLVSGTTMAATIAGPGDEDLATEEATSQLALRRRRRAGVEPHDHAFVVRPSRRGGWRWWLERGDGDRMATAPRSSATRQQAAMDTLRVRLAAASAPVETFVDDQDRVRWRLLSRAGVLLAVSAVGYASSRAAERAVASFRREASHAELVDD